MKLYFVRCLRRMRIRFFSTISRTRLLLMIVMFIFLASVAITESPEGYPEIANDPFTGKPYNFGGQTVYIYDYWSGNKDWHDSDPQWMTEDEQKIYAYRTWLEDTYNVRIVQTGGGDWGTIAEEMKRFTQQPNGLALYIIEPGKVGDLISGGYAASWNYDLSGSKWNRTEIDYMTIKEKTYGTTVGASEPKQVLFFNKRVLTEAGVNWNSIYDMQKNGTWTWEAFETILQQVTRDVDNDGKIDIYGLIGSADDMYVCAVFSNGASFFDFNGQGLLTVTVSSEAAKTALNWGKSIQENYWAPIPEGANWDWYKDAWKQGYCAFYMYQAYGGFNDNSEMVDMVDEWGCVAFPTAHEGGNYVTVVSDNVTMIPNCYDEATNNKLAFIYDMWTNTAPGIDNENSWIGNKYNYTDERAVDETYAMLRDPEHTVVNHVALLGTQNDILGSSLLWALDEAAPAELIEAGMPAWIASCESFNQASGFCIHEYSEPEVFDETTHVQICSKCGKETLAIHDFDNQNYISLDDQQHEIICRDCGYHWVAEHYVSCVNPHLCLLCGANASTVNGVIQHDYDPDVWQSELNSHFHVCSQCGIKLNEAVHFTYCNDVPNECSVCRSTLISTEDNPINIVHVGRDKKVFDSTGHWYICTACNELVRAIEEHKFGSWHYQDQQIHHRRCNVCGYRIAEDHNLSEDGSECLICGSSLVTVPYPEIKIDPSTGAQYDFGGKTVYIYDYWSGDQDWHDSDPNALSEEDRWTYEYRRWLEETYNVRIVQTQGGDWGTCGEEMRYFTENGDQNDELALFIVEPGKVGDLVSNGYAAPWNYDMNLEKWNQTEIEYMKIGDQAYGAAVGVSEPRQVLYFNKRVLSEAGIDWNTLYDMQQNGTWTWDAFETILQQVTKDNDGDGVNDIYGLIGSADDLYVSAVFSNGGSFFDYNQQGQLTTTVDSDATKQALTWGRNIQNSYWAPTPEGSNWDWYKDAWKQGYTAFYMYQAYGGFGDNSEMADMMDDWGCVAFPMSQEGGNYVTVVSDNITLIPSCYDNTMSNKLAFIYDMWTNETPGTNNEYSWIGNKYNYTDERAVDETYAMLRNSEHNVVNKVNLLGTQNDVLGSSLLWALGGSTPDELIASGEAAWQALCDQFNDQTAEMRTIDYSGLNVLVLPENLVMIGEEAFTNLMCDAVIIPDGCIDISPNAFVDCPNLRYVNIPASMVISDDVFVNCGHIIFDYRR